MMSIFVLTLLSTCVLSRASQTNSSQYIVVYNDTSTHLDAILEAVNLTVSHDEVHATFHHIGGFLASLPAYHADLLKRMPEVLHVERPRPVQVSSLRTTCDSPWGLQRISQAGQVQGQPSNLNFTYSFDGNSSLGAGVDIYIIDSGINVDHFAFSGRASNIYSFFNGTTTDSNGHGTHVAATAGGDPFGAAQGANILGVQVLDSNGLGTISSVIGAIEIAITGHIVRSLANDTHIGSVINLSLGVGPRVDGSPVSRSVAHAIRKAVRAGIHVVAAAGNEGVDACSLSLGAVGGVQGPAVVVGATDINDDFFDSSNWGPCVDILAPGVDVMSASIGSPNATMLRTGTSQAAPHVAGVIAYYMSVNRTLRDPSTMKKYLVSTASRSRSSTIIVNNGER